MFPVQVVHGDTVRGRGDTGQRQGPVTCQPEREPVRKTVSFTAEVHKDCRNQ